MASIRAMVSLPAPLKPLPTANFFPFKENRISLLDYCHQFILLIAHMQDKTFLYNANNQTTAIPTHKRMLFCLLSNMQV